MQAWRLVVTGQPLERCEVPDPSAGDGDVVVRLRASGLCATDVHLASGHGALQLPLTLGHEGAGEVVGTGERVAIHPMNPCGSCPACSAGQEQRCSSARPVGVAVDGTFASFVACRATAVVGVPEGVTDAAAAIATDAILTAYHAVHRGGPPAAGASVAVFGLGGLGLHAVQLAGRAGCEVVGVDPVSAKRDAALQLGASHVHEDGRPLRSSVDIALDLVGSEASVWAAHRAVRPGGRVVLAGLAADRASVSVARFGVEEISLVGCTSGTMAELRQCLQLLATGDLRAVVESRPLDTVNQQMERLRRGEVLGRVALLP